ncbi:UPF0182 family protein [Alicyclobacillus dauci]|uniref:UPF0182 family protein n=1 Tax=Alicyclobacillus dauci TaxID=1475485 RepID=A0ABY6Z3F8_9BACL|nr:UPF0182 family protein [Alicyclobacillus dauci]WAH37284.1 UPF0182 family protein [Alicyclobacillus dauci]
MTRIQRRGVRFLKILLAIILAIILVHVVLDRLFDYRLHQALGYGTVYGKMMVFELLTRYIGAALTTLLAFFQLRLFKSLVPKMLLVPITLVVCFLAYVIGFSLFTLDPTVWFTAFQHKPIGHVDPLLHLDFSFYVYVLPAVNAALARILFLYILSLVIHMLFLALTYALQARITKDVQLPVRIGRIARRVLFMTGILFVLFAGLAFISRYNAMLGAGNGSFVSGPDFVTANLGIGVFSWIHVAFLLLVAVSLFWLAVRPIHLYTLEDGFIRFQRRAFLRPVQAFGAFVASWIVTAIIGGLTNGLYVHPNQNTVELPYIKDSIDSTRWALNIENVQTKPFQGADTLTSAQIQQDANAIANVRVNDQNQTLDVYNQLQSFKSYFHFQTVSVDRYGNQEVYTSARQMDQSQLPVPTWINKTLVYTHGYGVAVSPVNDVTANGLPNLIARDTPQVTQSPVPTLKQPQIYFGTMDGDVIAPSKEAEFDYPSGSQDATSHYLGGYGLPVQGNRLLLMIEKGSLKFYTSDQLTAKSQYLFDRDIYQRVADIAPFLRYDNDAFSFVDERTGHVMWMLDAYTQSDNIPYADSFMGTRYIRNSVKVVMDGYTGETKFYVADQADPLLQTYMTTYPTLFTTQIPADIRAHFRYPTDLFMAQAQAFTRYHMTDPSAFYNQEDKWALANQIYQQNQTQPRDPVYQMIRMPGESQPSFVLSELYTPVNKDNLNGWLVADNGPNHYGELRLYQFPQSHLVFGPMQVENQIDANPSISQQLSLWNQQGSRVVRGNLLLVPIGDAMVYVEPIYLVASRDNSLPQLQRVIVDFGQKVYSGASLADALQNVVNGLTVETGTGLTDAGTSGTTSPSPTSTGGGSGAAGTSGAAGGAGSGTAGTGNAAGPGGTGTLAQQAQSWLQKYKSDTAAGNFAQAGQDLTKLGDILNQLSGQKGK